MGDVENFISAHPTGAGCPERRSLCKSNGGPYQSPADMRNHGSLGHAWSGWSSNHHGCLKYGACFSGLDAQDDSVLILRLKDEDLLDAPDDSAFLHSLRLSCSRVNGVYPPLALVEAFITEDDDIPRARRLHLYCGGPDQASEAFYQGKQTALKNKRG